MGEKKTVYFEQITLSLCAFIICMLTLLTLCYFNTIINKTKQYILATICIFSLNSLNMLKLEFFYVVYMVFIKNACNKLHVISRSEKTMPLYLYWDWCELASLVVCGYVCVCVFVYKANKCSQPLCVVVCRCSSNRVAHTFSLSIEVNNKCNGTF